MTARESIYSFDSGSVGGGSEDCAAVTVSLIAARQEDWLPLLAGEIEPKHSNLAAFVTNPVNVLSS